MRSGTPVVLRVFGQLIIFAASSLCTSRDNVAQMARIIMKCVNTNNNGGTSAATSASAAAVQPRIYVYVCSLCL